MKFKDIKPSVLQPIIAKQCSMVGIDPNTIDFSQGKDWFLLHEWDSTTEHVFRHWLVKYLRDNKETTRILTDGQYSRANKFLNRLADDIIFMWGWKRKQEDNKMICYKDVTFCNYWKECADASICDRPALTKRVEKEAEKAGLPIASFGSVKPKCFIAKKNSKENKK